MSEQNTQQGGSTAGLREAAMAKREAQQAAKQEPQFQPKPAHAATAVADADARQAHKKLPSRAEPPAPVEDEEPDLSALGDDDDEPATPPSAPSVEMVKVGDYEIPASVLDQLSDEHLARIKRKVRAGGEELEVTLADALASVPQARGWQKRMWEAAQREKQTQQTHSQLELIARSMSTDMVGAYAKLHGVSRGAAADKLAPQLLAAYNEADRVAQMSPEERERWERMDELERKARRGEELEQQEQERQQKAQAEREYAQIRQDMEPALRAAGVRPTEWAIGRTAALLSQAMRAGIITQVDASEIRWAASEVGKELAAEREAEWGEDADGEALIAKVGEKNAKAIARAYAARVQQKRQPAERSNGAKPRQQAAPEKPRSWSEWKRQADAAALKRDKARGLR